MADEKRSVRLPNSSLLLGSILIGLGVVFLLGELFNIRLGPLAWPLLILLPGGLTLILGLRGADHDTGVGLSLAGSQATILGLILFFQNLSGLWATWAYVWALVAPTGVGLGMVLYARRHPGRERLLQDGRVVMRIGLILFVVGFVFFELIIGVSGAGLGSAGWGILFIALGLILLWRNLVRRGAGES